MEAFSNARGVTSGNRVSFHVTFLQGDKGTGIKVLLLVRGVRVMDDAPTHPRNEGMVGESRGFIELADGGNDKEG
jgi:hypothetical protein